MYAVSHITGTTTYAWLIVPMIAIGFGVAAVFTTTSIATQNAVDFHDLGVATATIMFFRTLGGSIGLAAFGTILTSTVRSEIPQRLGVSAEEAASLVREPADIAALPAASRDAVVESLASGVGRIYLVCAGIMIVGLIAAILMPERELRREPASPTRWRRRRPRCDDAGSDAGSSEEEAVGAQLDALPGRTSDLHLGVAEGRVRREIRRRLGHQVGVVRAERDHLVRPQFGERVPAVAGRTRSAP